MTSCIWTHKVSICCISVTWGFKGAVRKNVGTVFPLCGVRGRWSDAQKYFCVAYIQRYRPHRNKKNRFVKVRILLTYIRLTWFQIYLLCEQSEKQFSDFCLECLSRLIYEPNWSHAVRRVAVPLVTSQEVDFETCLVLMTFWCPSGKWRELQQQ